MSELPIRIRDVSHSFGSGELRRQVLFDVSAEIGTGEIVILTGPSGSGKTTLLTLIGALRSTQEGSLRVLGHELRDADEATLSGVRARIGYIFQAHNLIESLSARQNVQMSLQLDRELGGGDIELRASRGLEAVGLGERGESHPSELSGGQRQRVAIARALAREPKIILADEPTASLDGETGRAVVELLEKLARKDGVTVVLVSHDPRIFDVADRILALEDGRLTSFMSAVASDAESRLGTLIREIQRGDLAHGVQTLGPEALRGFLEGAASEMERLLGVADLVQSDAFGGLLEQVMHAVCERVRGLIGADDASLYFVHGDDESLWSFGRCEHGASRESRVPVGKKTEGPPVGPDLVASLHATEDAREGGRLSLPVADSRGRAFAVLSATRRSGPDFADDDRVLLEEFAKPLGLVLESWWRMSCTCRTGDVGELPPCCR